ncbi:spleen protein tyrosine kinase [Capsaspora owczarzaki ATCC 30864]|uniref:TKL protein kinase n=1 Tax=Capsaspora owczarzaki (strain ATCC 30864) TaxID=595528 RepID=A0A0D2X4U7_CAPO3|nr:spleen protein tyrosine kinase [Capsaspora owczarzaki ATCC 30864]KJE96679.1 TKL protein kinase [Capsaspora owczarzaki ATCC 30864]|eukprot:XP_004343685.1 spleen protein tyrosine kinase [Capsaspora owczarzaki ATCC 30864]
MTQRTRNAVIVNLLWLLLLTLSWNAGETRAVVTVVDWQPNQTVQTLSISTGDPVIFTISPSSNLYLIRPGACSAPSCCAFDPAQDLFVSAGGASVEQNYYAPGVFYYASAVGSQCTAQGLSLRIEVAGMVMPNPAASSATAASKASMSIASVASVGSVASVSVASGASVASVATLSVSKASVASVESVNSAASVEAVQSAASVASAESVRGILSAESVGSLASVASQRATQASAASKSLASRASAASTSAASLASVSSTAGPIQDSESSSNLPVIVGAVVGGVALLALLVAGVLIRRRRRAARASIDKHSSQALPLRSVVVTNDEPMYSAPDYKTTTGDESNYATLNSYIDNYDLTASSRVYQTIVPMSSLLRSKLVLGAKLGSGAFGVVLRGQLPRDIIPNDSKHLLTSSSQARLDVAVKTVQADASEKEKRDFVEEMRMVTQFNNPNVVHSIAALLDADPLMCILELMPYGDLKAMLTKSGDAQFAWTLGEQAHALTQVAAGLEYLESVRFVHRDIAARNCLVGAGLSVKISDFGFSRSLAQDQNYYHMESRGKVPFKWMAPECISYRKFTHQSDVWAFGVLAWEVFSYGEVPYQDLKPQEVISYLESGLRLKQPAVCDDEVYNQMSACWNSEPQARPTFSVLKAYWAALCKDQEIRDIGQLLSL